MSKARVCTTNGQSRIKEYTKNEYSKREYTLRMNKVKVYTKNE